MLVENRTGAAAMIAASAVAKAPPDGHTLLMAASGEVAINHHVYKEKMTYDPMRELTPGGARSASCPAWWWWRRARR